MTITTNQPNLGEQTLIPDSDQLIEPWRILLVDDNEYFCRVVHQFLESHPEIKIVGTATEAETALTLAVELEPQIILLDLEMPGRPGTAIIPELKKLVPTCKIIILTLLDNTSYRRITLAAGADEFIPKSQLTYHLVPKIHQVMRSEDNDETC